MRNKDWERQNGNEVKMRWKMRRKTEGRRGKAWKEEEETGAKFTIVEEKEKSRERKKEKQRSKRKKREEEK